MNGHLVLSHVEKVHNHRKDPKNNNQPMEDCYVKDNLSKPKIVERYNAQVTSDKKKNLTITVLSDAFSTILVY